VSAAGARTTQRCGSYWSKNGLLVSLSCTRLAKTPRGMTQVPGRETRQGCQTRVDAVASLVGELQGEECACPVLSLSCWRGRCFSSSGHGVGSARTAGTCSVLTCVASRSRRTVSALLGARVFSALRLDAGCCRAAPRASIFGQVAARLQHDHLPPPTPGACACASLLITTVAR
jgi:hypothetical protein